MRHPERAEEPGADDDLGEDAVGWTIDAALGEHRRRGGESRRSPGARDVEVPRTEIGVVLGDPDHRAIVAQPRLDVSLEAGRVVHLLVVVPRGRSPAERAEPDQAGGVGRSLGQHRSLSVPDSDRDPRTGLPVLDPRDPRRALFGADLGVDPEVGHLHQRDRRRPLRLLRPLPVPEQRGARDPDRVEGGARARAGGKRHPEDPVMVALGADGEGAPHRPGRELLPLAVPGIPAAAQEPAFHRIRNGGALHHQGIHVDVGHREGPRPGALDRELAAGVIDRGGEAGRDRGGPRIPGQVLAELIGQRRIDAHQVAGPGRQLGPEVPDRPDAAGIRHRELGLGQQRHPAEHLGAGYRGAELEEDGPGGTGLPAAAPGGHDPERSMGGEAPTLALPGRRGVEERGHHEIAPAIERQRTRRREGHDPPERIGRAVAIPAAGLAELPRRLVRHR